MGFLKFAMVFFIVWFCIPLYKTASLFCQEKGIPFMRHYPMTEYKDGPQNWCIVEDKRGVIYAGNQEGDILEYDGAFWRKIETPDYTSIRSLAIDKEGKIYVGSVNEFGYLVPDSIGILKYKSLTYLLDSTIKDYKDIWSLSIRNDEVFFQARRHIFLLKDNKIKSWELPDLYHRSFVINNNFYVRQKGIGLTVFKNDTFELIQGGDFFYDKVISAMIPFDGQRILIGTRTNGLFLYDPLAKSNSISKFNNDADLQLSEKKLYHGIKMGHHFAFSTLMNGLIIIDKNGKIVDFFNKSNSLDIDEVYFLHNHNNTTLWAGLSNGVIKIDIGYPIRFWDKTSGITALINDICRHKGNLYLATDQGINYWDTLETKGDFISSRFKGLPGITNGCWCLISITIPGEDSRFKEQLLIGADDGLHGLINNKLYHIHENFAIFDLGINKVNPSIVFGAFKEGILKIEWDRKQKKWDVSTLTELTDEIRMIKADDESNFWATSMYNGVYKISFKKKNITSNETFNNTTSFTIEHYDTLNGLPNNRGNFVFPLNNSVIFGTRNGLYSYNKKDNKFVPDTFFNKVLTNKTILRLVEDIHGNVWVDNKIAFFKQRDGSFTPDSLILKGFINKRVDAIFAEKNGLIWYGGDGLYCCNSYKKFNPNEPFLTLIRKVSLHKDSLIFGGFYYDKDNHVTTVQPEKFKPIIDFKNNSLTFEFAAPVFKDEASTTYSYKLEGFDPTWAAWSKETKKEYTNLPEGNYIFKVKAKNLYNSESAEATYEFKILPPWYRKIWAYFIYILFFTLFVYTIVRIYSSRLKAANIKLENIVKERTKEILQQKEELATQRDALLEANATKDKFFSIISHDLKSPFNALLGFSEMLTENVEALSKEKIHRFSSQIFNSAKQLFNLVENLLAWSRSKSNKIKTYPGKIDINILIEDNIEIVKITAKNKNIKFEVFNDKDCFAYADENLISTILRNLVSNAIKYSIANGIIKILTLNKGGMIETSVSDQGVGISEENLNKLFREDVHYTTKGTEQEKGTGLGLILCKEFVEKSGGKIWVESREGKGTTFYFTVPVFKEGQNHVTLST